MTDYDRNNLIKNILGAFKGVNRDILERQIRIFYKCDPEYGNRLAQGLGFPALKSKI